MRTKLAIAISLAIAGSQALAAGNTVFDEFNALPASTGPIANEANALVIASPAGTHQFTVRSVADRATQIGLGQLVGASASNPPAIGTAGTGTNWDMITLNETGPDAGRYLFTPYEDFNGPAGIQRTDLQNNYATKTFWLSPGAEGTAATHVAFDASYWTPWGTYITAEESWGTGSSFGRLFEVTNPLTANDTASTNFFHRNIIPRTSHEGIQFDAAGNMYFIDELNGGTVFKYDPLADIAAVKSGAADYWAAGQTSVLRVGDGSTANATGAFSWVAFTDINGAALAGAVSITDANGVTSIDGRATADLAAFKGTDYQRPEDLQLQVTTINGDTKELLYMATTTTDSVYTINLTDGTISFFATGATTDLATGNAVGSGATGMNNTDNLAIDADGNLYIIEDSNGGSENDVWMALDLNKDGDLADAGEGLKRWLTNGAVGSELTGLYFDPFNPNRAWINVQHPNSGVDRTFEIAAVPVPAALPLLATALGGLGVAGRRRK